MGLACYLAQMKAIKFARTLLVHYLAPTPAQDLAKKSVGPYGTVEHGPNYGATPIQGPVAGKSRVTLSLLRLTIMLQSPTHRRHGSESVKEGLERLATQALPASAS